MLSKKNSSHVNCLCNTPQLYMVAYQTHHGWRNWERRLVNWKGLCCRRHAVLDFYCHTHSVPVRSRWNFINLLVYFINLKSVTLQFLTAFKVLWKYYLWPCIAWKRLRQRDVTKAECGRRAWWCRRGSMCTMALSIITSLSFSKLILATE